MITQNLRMEEHHAIQRTLRRPKTTVINLAKVGCYKLTQKKGLRAPRKTDFEISSVDLLKADSKYRCNHGRTYVRQTLVCLKAAIGFESELVSKRDDLHSLCSKGNALKKKLTDINALAIGTPKIWNTFTNTFNSVRKGDSIIILNL